MRSNELDTAQRAQTMIARGTLRKADDKHHWQQVDVDVMASETHTGIERPQSYGSTSYPADQDEDEQKQKADPSNSAPTDGGAGGQGNTPGDFGEQPKGDSAEVIIGYLGSHSHPVVLAIDDRRHRLKELEAGDNALHRLQDDRQQFLMHKEGTYLSTRDDKTMRIALVPKPDDQQQGGGEQTRGGSTGGGEKKKKEKGQKSARDDNLKSQVYIDQSAAVTDVGHGQHHAAVRGSDASTYNQDRKRSTQVTNEHSHLRTMDNRIFTDEQGCWSETPIQVKKDRYCKE